MKAEKMILRNFRNYGHLEIDFHEGINILCGKNAQGKTNLLEGLYYFAALRSFRGGKDRDLVAFGENFFENILQFDKEGRSFEFTIKYDRNRKQIFLNGVKKAKSADVLGSFLSVLFAPEHLNLVKNGPAERRKFIDLALCQLKPSYFAALSEYAKVLEQKAALLKNYETGRFDEGLFDIYNERLSKAGAFIIRERFRYTGLLNQAAQVFHGDISSGKEELYVNYIPSPKIEEGFTAQEGEAVLYRELSMVKKREIITGLCIAGPHRDNLEFTINGKDARLFCSQGQQRSLVLSLKLAECELFKAEFSQYPVLLLDDIMSELDRSRQNYILNQIRGKQVLITCCGEELFAPVGSKAIFIIKDGKVQKEE